MLKATGPGWRIYDRRTRSFRAVNFKVCYIVHQVISFYTVFLSNINVFQRYILPGNIFRLSILLYHVSMCSILLKFEQQHLKFLPKYWPWFNCINVFHIFGVHLQNLVCINEGFAYATNSYLQTLYLYLSLHSLEKDLLWVFMKYFCLEHYVITGLILH